jgi:Zn-dependent protease with chaperone function
MASSTATFYDGQSSKRHQVILTWDKGEIIVSGEGIARSYAVSGLQIDDGLGKIKRTVRFPDGAVAETSDERFIDALQRSQGTGGFFKNVRRWEMSLPRAAAALLLTLLVCFGFIRYGLPFLATKAAFALPPATEKLMGSETLQLLDRAVFKPSKLPVERQKSLTRLFSTITSQQPEGREWRLEFRSSAEIGANAFALPSGIVVVTDDLVNLATSEDEIAGVMAHEVGHVNQRHALRHLLQNSATALLVATLTGDITSASSLAATMPTLLIDAKYSRDFEREADDAAVAYLKKKRVPVQVYAEMLGRLDAAHWKDREKTKSFGDLFQSHPETKERVQRVLQDAEAQGK